MGAMWYVWLCRSFEATWALLRRHTFTRVTTAGPRALLLKRERLSEQGCKTVLSLWVRPPSVNHVLFWSYLYRVRRRSWPQVTFITSTPPCPPYTTLLPHLIYCFPVFPAFELFVCFMYHTQVSHHMTISHRNPASTFWDQTHVQLLSRSAVGKHCWNSDFIKPGRQRSKNTRWLSGSWSEETVFPNPIVPVSPSFWYWRILVIMP